MQTTYTQLFVLFVFSCAVVGVLTPLMRKVAISNQIFDAPNASHKSHAKSVPYLGGIAIMLGVVLVSFAASIFNENAKNNLVLLTTVLVPAIAMGLVGLWDDIKNLPPLPRLFGQTISGLIVAILLISSDNVANPTGSTLIDFLISIVWIVGICNSINFFDNLDGGAAGTTAISAIFITYLAFSNSQNLISALSVVVAGSTIGFLVWNKSPARIYMGDAGALFLGVLLATLTIRLDPNTETIIASFATPILLLAIPILDTCVAVFSRFSRGISPLQGGRDHLSHRLIRLGISRKATAVILWMLSGLFGLLAIAISIIDKNLEIPVVFLSFLIWIFLFIYFSKIKVNKV